jgi:hypothetical protein
MQGQKNKVLLCTSVSKLKQKLCSTLTSQPFWRWLWQHRRPGWPTLPAMTPEASTCTTPASELLSLSFANCHVHSSIYIKRGRDPGATQGSVLALQKIEGCSAGERVREMKVHQWPTGEEREYSLASISWVPSLCFVNRLWRRLYPLSSSLSFLMLRTRMNITWRRPKVQILWCGHRDDLG